MIEEKLEKIADSIKDVKIGILSPAEIEARMLNEQRYNIGNKDEQKSSIKAEYFC